MDLIDHVLLRMIIIDNCGTVLWSGYTIKALLQVSPDVAPVHVNR